MTEVTIDAEATEAFAERVFQAVALLEHVRSSRSSVAAVQRLLDPLAVRFQGDHLLREPADVLEAEGLLVEDLRRWRLGLVERVVAYKRPPT